MEFDLYEKGIEALRNEDNIEWIDKIKCWVKKEVGYNIYIFQVTVDNQKEIIKYYEAITASIAIEFQAELEKAIEKWNIYLVFTCKENVDWKIKQKVEQDKYAVRKIIWDSLNEEELNSKDYLRKRLLCFEISETKEKPKEKEDLNSMIRERDYELFNVLQKNKLTIEEKAVMYIGDGTDE